MFKNHFRNLLFRIRNKLNLIIFILLATFNKIYSQINIVQGRNPNCLLLQNGYLFITNINGMFLYDTELQNQYKSHIYYNKTINEQNINSISQNTIIAQFSEENGIIICLVENALYFFNHDGDFILMDFLPNLYYDYSSSYMNLLTYKKDENFYYYIIAFIKDNEINIFYYKVNNIKNELIHQEIFKPFYFDFPEIYIFEKYLGCGIMNSENKGNVLTCCFQTKKEDFIIIQSFIIEQEFEPIGEDIYSKIESPSAKSIHSVISENGKQLLACYRQNNEHGYCLVYDIDQNKIIKNNPLIQKCSEYYYRFKLFYFSQTHEFLSVCSNSDKDFTIIKMDKNFNVLNNNTFSKYNYQINDSFYSFSIFYDNIQNKYAFIIDPNYITGKHIITTEFNSSIFDGGTPPSPFNEIIPSTNPINLSPESKYFLNINQNYYRSITINEINGIFIDFLDKNNQLIKTKENEEIRKELYAINIHELPSGQLKHIINGEEVNANVNKRFFGEFKFKYIPSGVFPEQTKITYYVYLKNYSIASLQGSYWLITCKKNCSCERDTGNCQSCANGYSFYQSQGNCIKGKDICSYNYYTNNSTQFLVCLNQNDACPLDYPIYDDITRECRQNITDIPSTELINAEQTETEDSTKKPTTESTELEENEDTTKKPTTESTELVENEDSTKKSTTESTQLVENEDSTKKPTTESTKLEENEDTTNNQTTESIELEENEDTTKKSTTESTELEENEDTTKKSTTESTELEENEDSTKKPTTESTEEDFPLEQSDNNKESSNYEENESDSTNINSKTKNNIVDWIEDEIIEKIIDWILGKKNFTELEKLEEIKEPNKGYEILSNIIQNGNINMSLGNEDIILKVENVIYQITNTENQEKEKENSDLSNIDLGECEKIIKKSISYEDDPTPLIILKLDIKKESQKSPLVVYGVYNPYTKEKINLDICSNTKITISSPVNLTAEETSLYEDLKKQGYDLFDANDTFYQDICTPFTSQNGTDVILSDRKYYYYDKNISFCQDSCIYNGINTEKQKVVCICDANNEIDFNGNYFDKTKFFEKFYKVEDYTNYQVLFCYKLAFSSKGLLHNICFYIFIALFSLFLSTMIINLLNALKKIDKIIFKIFQDKFMFEIMQNIIKSKKIQNQDENNSKEIRKSIIGKSKNLNIFQKLRLKYKNKTSTPNNDNKNINNNLNNKNNENDNNNEISNNNDIINISHNIDNNNRINNINNNNNSNIIDINNKTNSNNSNNNDKKIFKIKNLKMSMSKKINDKQNINYRMNYKINYSNSIRDKNFNLSNIFDEIMNKDNKNSSSILVNNKEDKGKIINENIINSSKNIINMSKIKNINESSKSFKKYIKRKTAKINSNIINFNLRNSMNSNNFLKINHNNNINNNDLNSNPPIKKNDNKEVNCDVTNRNRNQNQSQDSSSSDKKIFYKKPLQSNLKRKSKTKILRKSLDILSIKQKGISFKFNNNPSLVNLKNEDTTIKNHLLQKNLPIINEKKVETQNKSIGNPQDVKKKNSKYIDEELNKMEYENALIYDQREYCQYYISLLKKKHLIILVFISNEDYNVFLLKFSLFILSISLFFAINTLFFRDSTMRYIFKNRGAYNILYQIPQVLYSTLISLVMTFILKKLSLSQNDLIDVKKESDKAKAKKMADSSKKCFKLKLYAFFIIGLCLLLFCWYYVTAFAAVYSNTQLHLIKDTLISFGISMVYPFIINLIPGLLRIPALKSVNKDRKCMYKISKFIALF